MVRHKSHSQTDGERELARIMAREMESLGLQSELQAFDNGQRFNAIWRLKGTGGGKSLLFNGNLDTNPVTEGWTVDPWGGLVDDKFIYGIGVSNMKAGDAAYFCAVKAHAAMDAAAIDLLLIDSGELLAWLTGYTVSETMYRAALLPRHGSPWFVLRELDEAPCREKTWITDVVGFTDSDDPYATIADSIRARGFTDARIGADFNAYSFSAQTAARLKACLPQAEFVSLFGISDSLRWVKSPREIVVLADASAIADKAMRAIVQNVRVGSSTRAAAATAAATFLLEGADSGETGPIVKASGNHEFLHGAFKGELLDVGDILHVELIPRVGGYGARLMRPIAIGDKTVKLRDIAARIIAVQDEQMEAMKPGALARDVDAITRQGLISSGLRPRYDNVTAYTLGLYTRTPRTSDFSRVLLPDADWPLEEGMVFHVYATAARLGFSETVVVTSEGGRRLTTTARQLLTAGQS